MNAPVPLRAPLVPLSPRQARLLTEHLRGGLATEDDLEQLEVSLEAEPDEAVLARAWGFVASWRPALTTRFRWREVPMAVQEPQPGVALPMARLDWRRLPPAEQARRRDELLDADRLRGFDLAVAPLMRVTVLALGGGRASLLWTVHPVLLDGRALAEVLLQVFSAYDALRCGAEPRPPQAPAAAPASTDGLAGPDPAAARAFFQALLEGKAAPTALPCAEPARRPLPAQGHGEAHLVLAPEASAGLGRLAGARGTTVGTVVQAAWALVLSRLTGEEDVLFGVTPSFRRTTLGCEAEGLAAPAAQAVPARLRIDEAGTVAAFLAAVEAQAAALAPYLHTPFAELEAPATFPAGAPLFETVLGFDSRRLEPPPRASFPGWAERPCQLHRQPAVPLAVSVVHDGETALAVRYDRRRYRPVVAARIAAYLATTLERLGQVERVGEVDVLPMAERRLLLEGWNDTAAPFGDTLLIHQPFERQADLQGQAVAVECEDQRLTFAELEAGANRLANALAARGLGPGCYVGLCVTRGLGLITGLLGIAKSGAAYVPLDPDYPRERLAFMLADAGATVVVSEARFAGRFTLPVLELEAPEVAGASPRRPLARATADQPCYAIYTSGSTGTPKGVELAHRAVLNTLEWVSRSFAVQPGDRLLFVTSPCFDLSVYDTFGALGAGATVVVASAERLAEPRQVVRLLVEAGITLWDSAPAALQRLVPFFPPRAELALRLVLLSGDWIPLSLPDVVRRTFPRAQVVSLGGATEAAIWSNWFPVEAIDPRWVSVPYGRPIQNASYFVLDGRRQPVPRGVTGDLYIAGACLARGYLRRLELTAERFVPCPFLPGERMYLTGDLARHFEDGTLEFLGRADFQVKVRGYRVELGEVEAALLALDGVREAVATTFVDATGTRALVAYVVPAAGAGLSPDGVRASLEASLPDFMVPGRVLMLAALPLSASGKLDRKALPAPGTQAARARTRVAPRSDAEQRMVATWEAVLEQHPIGVTDNFFQLGGDSLLAVVLSARLEQELGIELPLSRLLARPTVESLLASLAEPAARGRHLVTLTPAAPSGRAPLVLLSGAGGFGFFFQGLADRLGGAQPVHVLHAVGAEDEREGLEHTIEELAAIYEPQVLAACPAGPVVLGGYSFGAMIAFELTRRLVARGREVPLLVSFDGMAPGHPRLVPMPERLLLHLGTFLVRDASGRREYLRGRLARFLGRLRATARGDPRLAAIEGPAQATAARLERVAAGLWGARARYAPTSTVGSDVLLFKATEPLEWPGCRSDGRYGWGDATRGQVHVEPVPGRHHGLFSAANDDRMARVLGARLELLARR